MSAVSATEIDDGTSKFNSFSILGEDSMSNSDNGDFVLNDVLEENESSNGTENINSTNITGDSNGTVGSNSTNITGDSNGTVGSNSTNITNKTNSTTTIKFATKGTVTLTEVCNAASNFKKFIVNNYRLPSYITVGSYKVSPAQFTYLMACAITNINNGHSKYKIKIIPINVNEITGDFIVKNATKTTFVKWAKNVVSKGSSANIIYSYITYSSSKLAFKDYTNTFAKILVFYKSNKKLPTYTTIETFVSTNKSIILLGSNSLGKVELIGPFGNTSSKVKIAYSIGVHVREYQAHNALYHALDNQDKSLKYCYYIYKITLAKPTGDYSKDRMSGQLLAQKYTLPHGSKRKYTLFVDVHSTVGKAYKYSYFVFVPGNKNKNAINIAKTVVSKNKNMVYYNPPSQTSPKYLTLPLVNKGTPTFVFETRTGEYYTLTLSKLKSLVKSVDSLFNDEDKLIVTKKYVKVSDIIKASNSLKNYMDTHKKKTPSSIKVGSYKVNAAQFDYLMAITIQKINSKNIGAKIVIINVATPKIISYKINSAIKKSTYITVANNVAKFMSSNKKAPNYVSIGKSKAKYTLYTYSFANILVYYNDYNKLPTSCKFKS